jgi:hypothetical protein
MFCEIISSAFSSFLSFSSELNFSNAVLNPIEPYIDGLAATLLDGFVCNSGSGGVVSDDGCRGLRMAHFGERCLMGTGFFAVVEKGTKFGFGSG